MSGSSRAGAGTPRRHPRRRENENVVENAASGRLGRAAGADAEGAAGPGHEPVGGRPGIAGLHPAAGRASRGPLNGFPGALAGVLRHRIGAGWRRLPDTSATGLSDAAKAGEPAYPPWPHFAGPRRELAGGCAPSDPTNGNGAS